MFVASRRRPPPAARLLVAAAGGGSRRLQDPVCRRRSRFRGDKEQLVASSPTAAWDEKHRCTPTALQQQVDAPESYAIAGLDLCLRDPAAVQKGAVGRPEVGDDDAVAIAHEHGVPS